MRNEPLYRCANWAAIRAGEDLLVYSGCTFPTRGWRAELGYANPGINPNPKVLVLQLMVTQPAATIPNLLTSALVTLQTGARQIERVAVHLDGDPEIRYIEVRDIAL